MPGTLLLILAHPDDETMGNGTLILRHVAAGCDVHLVCATRGGAGWNGRPADRTQDELPAIRSDELGRAAEILGLASVDLWDYPDGGLAQCDQDEVTGRIARAVERLRPDVVVTWGPDGGYGHPDHIATGACADRALRGSAIPCYHSAVDRETAEAWRAAMQDRWSGPMEVKAAERLDAVFDATPAELAQVRAALLCHDSQLNETTQFLLADEARFRWVARNAYVRVSGPPIQPVATSLLPELEA